MTTPNDASLRIATTDGIAGQRIVTTLAVVLGLAVRTRGLAGNIMAGIDALGNGSAMDEYRGDLMIARREALAQLEAHAREIGANAVVGLRFNAAEAGYSMSEIVAYGTAVIIVPDP